MVVALLLATSGLLTCRGTTEPFHLAYLPGSWQWVSSRDVRSQQTHTPSTEGHTARLQFISDSERSGTFVYTRDGQTAVQGRYDIGFEDAPGNDFVRLSESIDFLTKSAWIAVGSDTLRLDGVMELGYNSVYARIHE